MQFCGIMTLRVCVCVCVCVCVVNKNNNFRGSVYMVFDFAEHDLTGLMHTQNYRFRESEVCV